MDNLCKFYMTVEISLELCYFLGLITGRGKIYSETNTIVINFPAKKSNLTGIPYCPKCNDGIGVVTGFSEIKICKMCGKKSKPQYDIDYNYDIELIPAIMANIFPIIKKIIKAEPIITKTKNDVRVSINFSNNEKLFKFIKDLFSPYHNYDNFEIPNEIKSLDKSKVKEFVMGIADAAGFPAWGAWHQDGDGIRTRVYFEFPNNWKLPVQLCNLMQNKFEIHTQTIDWGHPNFRDPKMVEYNKGNTIFGFKEHQLKYWADEFSEISYKLKFKKEIFDELCEYNTIKTERRKETCIPPIKLRKNNITIHHPGEDSLKNPIELRGIHFDKFQQVCWKLGCDKCDDFRKEIDSEGIFITGLRESDDFRKEIDSIENERKKLQEEMDEKWKKEKKISEGKKIKIRKVIHSDEFLEKDTYEPQKIWLKKYLEKKFPKKKIETFIGATVDLSSIPGLNLEELGEFPIKPDVIGIIDGKSLAFIESKITKANLREIGQLLSYCIIAKPEIAILCSTIDSKADLHPILEHKALNFGSKQIQCATWIQEKKEKKVVKLTDMVFYA